MNSISRSITGLGRSSGRFPQKGTILRLLLLGLVPDGARAADVEAAPPVGLVLSIAGGPWRVQSNSMVLPVALDAKIDYLRPVFADEHLRCEGPGVLRVLLLGSGKETNLTSTTWTRIERPRSSPQDRLTFVWKGLASGGDLRSGAGSASILSPAHENAVRLESLELSWIPDHFHGDLDIRVFVGGKEVWCVHGVPTAEGRFGTVSLRERLARALGEGPLEDVVLRIKAEDERTSESVFTVLGRATAKQVEDKLRRLDDIVLPPVLKHVARAGILAEYQLGNEEVAALVAAMNQAGASPGKTLLTRYAEACRIIGDHRRALDLERRAAVSGGDTTEPRP